MILLFVFACLFGMLLTMLGFVAVIIWVIFLTKLVKLVWNPR